MVAARLFCASVHSLLNHDPVPVVADDEAVQIELKPVLDCRAVPLGDEPACSGETRAIDADALSDGFKLVRGLPRILAAAAADVNPQFLLERTKPPLQRT